MTCWRKNSPTLQLGDQPTSLMNYEKHPMSGPPSQLTAGTWCYTLLEKGETSFPNHQFWGFMCFMLVFVSGVVSVGGPFHRILRKRTTTGATDRYLQIHHRSLGPMFLWYTAATSMTNFILRILRIQSEYMIFDPTGTGWKLNCEKNGSKLHVYLYPRTISWWSDASYLWLLL